MNSKSPAVLRALYIVLVPIVALIILLNSGWLQRLVPAARMNGESYSVVRYNYYYFDFYNSFLEENELRLDELGYDPSVSDTQQSYDGSITWKEFFQRQAEASMAETAYYCDLAQAAGYTFSDKEMAPLAEKLAANEARRLVNNISAKNYYVSYYGSGMSESRYTAELTRQVRAQAYKAHLIQAAAPSREEIDAYLAEHPSADYLAVDMRAITLDALPDRATGEIGPEQLTALEEKLSRLAARYEAGVPFEELRAAFSTCELGDGAGVIAGGTAATLPDAVAAWCLTGQDALAPGDTAEIVDEESGTAYFLVLDGFGGPGGELEAIRALGEDAVQAEEDSQLADYTVQRLRFGMMLATA